MYAIVARWLVKAGHEDEVEALLREMLPHARSEPGCVMYEGNRDVADPRRFLLYEQYRDEAAFQAHIATDAFREIVANRIAPLLEERARETYLSIDL